MAFFPDFCSDVPKVLLHVGASLGHEAGAYMAAGIRHVIWVEADPDIHQMLVHNVAAHRHTCINALATDRDGDEVTFWVTSNQGMSSSVFPMQEHLRVFPHVQVTHAKRLKTSRLDTRLRLEGIKVGDIDAVVIDVQGAELLALKGLGEYLSGVQILITEFSRIPLYDGGVLHEELDAFLVEQGFVYVQESKGAGHGDALYVRRAAGQADREHLGRATKRSAEVRCHPSSSKLFVQRHRKGIRFPDRL